MADLPDLRTPHVQEPATLPEVMAALVALAALFPETFRQLLITGAGTIHRADRTDTSALR